MNKIRIGVIGLGAMGRAMLAAAKDHPDAAVTLACDPDPVSRGRIESSDHPLLRLTSIAAEVWTAKEIDAVYIATPPATHAAFAIAALDAGKAVLCEKPLATHSDDGAKMVAAARRSGLVNAIHFPLCDRKAVRFLEQAIERGELGSLRNIEMRLFFPAWPREFQQHAVWLSGRAEGGYLREVFSHYVYLTQRLVGPMTIESIDIDYTGPSSSECRAYGSFRAGAADMTLVSHAGLGGPETYEWSLYGEKEAYRLVAWRHLQRSRGGEAWQDVALPGEQGSERTRLTQFAHEVRGSTRTLPDFAVGLAVQKVVERCHDQATSLF